MLGRFTTAAPPEEPHLPGTILANPRGITAAALVGLLFLGTMYTLYLARALLIPIATATLLGFLLKPVIRMLRRFGIPEVVGTVAVFGAFMGTVGAAAYFLAPPAARVLSQLPEDARAAEVRLRGVLERFGEVREAVDEVASVTAPAADDPSEPEVVRVAPELLSDRIIGGARAFAVGVAFAAFLLFLIMASGETFLRRTISLLPTLDQQKRLVRIIHGIERDVSAYLVTTSVINTALGIALGLAFALLGMPNPVLWGVVVALLNYIPYVGSLVGVLATGLVALATFQDLGYALLAPAVYVALNGIETFLLTPHVVGARFSINPVAVFIAVAFWGWIWGIPGALLAVPILTATSIVCDNIDGLRPIAVILRS
jgi:predicted PurR-regulated permease PerM